MQLQALSTRTKAKTLASVV